MPNYLYLLVRTDMESMGRGKGTAQAAHAANQFTWDHVINSSIEGKSIDPAVLDWCREARGFGTTIALDAPNLQVMAEAVELAKALGFAAELVADPEYPLVDGNAFHIIPNVTTTAYVFGDKDKLKIILQDFKLLDNDPVKR